MGGLTRHDFEVLFRESWLELVRLAGLLVGDRAAAEDVVQDAFANVYRRWDRMRDFQGARAYTRTAVVHGCHSMLRRNAVRRLRSDDVGREAVGQTVANDPALAADDELLSLIRELPRRQREIVVLRYWADLAEAEIAATLGISAGTVKSGCSRAIRSLSRQMGRVIQDG